MWGQQCLRIAAVWYNFDCRAENLSWISHLFLWAYSSLVIQLPALVEEHSNTWQIRIPLLRRVPNIPKLNDKCKEFRYSPKDMEPQVLSLLFLAFTVT